MGARSLARQAGDLPATPGVYAFRDKRGRLLYVGKAVNLKRRVGSYLERDGGHTGYTRKLKRRAARIEVQETGSELEALLAEARAIRAHQPAYNVVGRHARHYAFVKLTFERFPQVVAVREIAPDGARYYGPFPPELDVAAALGALHLVLKWRRCEILERKPCLHHQVGRCMAPCAPASESPRQDPYDAMLTTLDHILRGDARTVLATLDQKMREAAARHAFERAARLRDRLRALERVLARSPFLTLDVVAAGWCSRRKSARSRKSTRSSRRPSARRRPGRPCPKQRCAKSTSSRATWSAMRIRAGSCGCIKRCRAPAPSGP